MIETMIKIFVNKCVKYGALEVLDPKARCICVKLGMNNRSKSSDSPGLVQNSDRRAFGYIILVLLRFLLYY